MKVLSTTADAVAAILKADPSLSALDRKQYLAILRNGANGKGKAQSSPAPTMQVIVRPAQAAAMLGRGVRSIHALCSQGLLKKAMFPGRQRAAGITQESLTALLNASNGDAK